MNRLKYFLAAVSAAFIWGFFSIPLRNLKAYPAELILDYRILTSLIITWLIIILSRRHRLKSDYNLVKNLPESDRKKTWALVLISGILITCNWFTFIYAINNVSLKSAAFAYMVCPLITALGGFLILKEHLSGKKLWAIAVAFISVCILAKGSVADVTWSVIIAAFYAFYLITQRVLNLLDKLNTLGIQLIIAMLLMLPLFIYRHQHVPVEPMFWINILIVSGIFTVLPLFLSLYALEGIQSGTMGIIIYINPIISFAIAFLYFHETVTQLQVFSYALLFAAVILFNFEMIYSIFNGRFKFSTEKR